MLDIQALKNIDPSILCIGSHPGIIQAMLDFDYLAGKSKPGIVGIISKGKRYERYFWGTKELLLPVYEQIRHIEESKRAQINLFLNLTSARRVFSKTVEALEYFPNILGGVIFGENVPEKDTVALLRYAQEHNKFIIGPSSVGLLIPGVLKIGAIGGVQARQLVESTLFSRGNIAVFSASGGMTNELVRLVALKQKSMSFSLSFGGDRFPVVDPKEAFLAAENDPDTECILYFGELGGYDEYEIAKLLEEKKITKKVVAYIGGTISEMFETPPQFGHAKAMAQKDAETARAKRAALRQAGAIVGESFQEFVKNVEELPSIQGATTEDMMENLESLEGRKHALFINTLSGEKDGQVQILGEDLLTIAGNSTIASLTISMLLGRKIISADLEHFVDLVFKLAVDHGPNVSGAVTTMITARAGKDMVSSLAAGLLTIGPRFGGAINEAAANWLLAIEQNQTPFDFVESIASQNRHILGIGHKKYRIDYPDPRVAALLTFSERLQEKKFITFAKEVEKITTSKKGNLILNVDGTIAALMLDFLHEKEGFTFYQLKQLVDIEFFNALFILPRSIGFVSHYLDQKRLDEGLFRLPDSDVVHLDLE